MISNSYDEFMKKHNIKKSNDSSKEITHTKIGSKESNIFAGSFHILDDYNEFLELYYHEVIMKQKKEYLTEKQLKQNSPLLVDIDLRYLPTVVKRQHTQDHISDMIQIYLENLKKIFSFSKETEFYVYIMEKPNVNCQIDKNVTKDGIHMIIGIQIEHCVQLHLRQLVLKELSGVWSTLEITNTIEQVLDEGITKGVINWQMYGSRKPDNDAYELTYMYKINYDEDDAEFSISSETVTQEQIKNHFPMLSARYSKHPVYPLKNDYVLPIKEKKIKEIIPVKTISSSSFTENMDAIISKITNLNILTETMNMVLDSFKDSEYYIKEIHYFTQILPKRFYDPGSHLLNREVCFALKSTHNDLFLSWVMLRSKAEDFDYDDIPNLYKEWCNTKIKDNRLHY